MGTRFRLRGLVLLAALAACGDNRSLPPPDGGGPAEAGPPGPCAPRLGDLIARLPQPEFSGQAPWRYAFADFDGDGLPDIAAAGLTGGDNGGQAFASILFNQGGGTFVEGQVFRGVGCGAAGDLTGDGAPDVVLSSGAILVNDGTGSFEAGPFSVPADASLGRVSLGDVDGDGHLDLVGISYIRPPQVVYVRNLGGGTFGPAQAIGPGYDPLVIGDVDGDGRLDVAVGTAADRTVIVYRQQGDGTFAGAAVDVGADTDQRPVVAVALADLDGDARLDLAALVRGATGDFSLAVRLYAGEGSFGPLATYPAGRAGEALGLGDLNGDGAPDAAIGYAFDDLHVRLNDGHGGFGTPLGYDGHCGYAGCEVAIVDVDADGRNDVIMGGEVLLNGGCRE